MRMTIPGIEKALGDGVYTVLERAINSGSDRVIGVALSLAGAMNLVLDAAGFEFFTETEDPNEMSSIVVDSLTPGAAEKFLWYDESTCGGRYAGRFEKGDGEMRAYFENAPSPFVVHWTELRA